MTRHICVQMRMCEMQSNLGLPEMLLGTSGVKFLRTTSNMEGLRGLAIPGKAKSFFFVYVPAGTPKSVIKFANAPRVGNPSYKFKDGKIRNKKLSKPQ